MLAKGSNSGVYMHSLYECQIFDSWGSTEPVTSSDGGGIYHRWIDNHGVGGSAPSRNASRRPGEWQSYHIWFRAPRFDAAEMCIRDRRMILELRDKMPAPSGEEAAASSGGPGAPSGALTAIEQDVLSALLNLGCARPAAESAVRKARVAGAPPAPDTEFEPLFRRALELVR